MKILQLALVLVFGITLLGATQLNAQDTPQSGGMHGVELPNPLGVGVTYYNQNQPYQSESMNVQFPGLDSSLLQDLKIENETSTLHLRVDYWLLPFLNVFGVLGSIDSSTEIGLSSVDLGMPLRLDDLKVNLDGTVYGAGLVLAFGGQKWFGTFAYQFNETSLDEINSSVSAWVLTPKVGLRFRRGAAWVGAMYQNAQEEHEGLFDVPQVGEVTYQVKLHEEHPWNFVAGGSYGFSKHWLLTAQGGVGDRMSVLGMVEYRF